MKGLLSVLCVLFLVMFIVGCQPKTNSSPNITIGAVITSSNTTTNISKLPTVNKTEVKSPNVTGNVTPAQTKIEKDYESAAFVITGKEGDLIKIALSAKDPDGDKLTYKYSSPFNQNGLWQTKDGDAGKYLVTVTASDGKSDTSADVLIVINPRNKEPVIDCPEKLTVKEGDTVELKCNFFDKENDPLVIDYSGWMSSTTYTTNYASAGEHKVFVKVSDGTNNVSKTVNVIVENVDRAPIFNVHLKDLTITESDIVTLSPNITDPDGDTIKLTFSDPINSKGIWKTIIGDAGTYPITVVASDGTLSTKETFTLTVKMLNTAPVMKLIPNISLNEGDTITIKPDVADREKDPITVAYTGWMKTSTYTTTYDDAHPKGCSVTGCSATYKVTVTASDGVYKAVQDVYITVRDTNRPPVFTMP